MTEEPPDPVRARLVVTLVILLVLLLGVGALIRFLRPDDAKTPGVRDPGHARHLSVTGRE